MIVFYYLFNELVVNIYKKNILLYYIIQDYSLQNILLVKLSFFFKNDVSWDYASSNLIYLFFFFVILFNSLGIILSKNPIHSIFFLILVFLNVGFFLLFLCVEFVAFLIFIVYLGAIAVLFLFVIMMFNVHILEVRDNILRYLPLIILIFGVIFEMIYVTNFIHFNIEGNHFNTLFYSKKSWYNLIFSKENMTILTVIYTYYLFAFILVSIILLIAMIGAIFLTLNILICVKKQEYYKQNTKILYNSLVLKKKNVKSFDFVSLKKKSTSFKKRKPWWKYF